MTTENTIQSRLLALQDRLNLTQEGLSEYLGVPHHTVIKWCSGKRIPASVVHRLLDVLSAVEAMAPALHSSLMPKP